MARFFAFLFVEDRAVSKLLTTAIYVLNPRAKWPAHVTLSGPYESRRNVPRKLDFQRRVLVTGAGHFRSATQNTVFLRVGASDLRKVSRKADYEYNPHITLYDGVDHDLGDELYHQLKPKFPFMKFDVSEIKIVTTGLNQPDFDFIFNELDRDFLQGNGVDIGAVDSLDNDSKVRIAVRAVDQAILVSQATD